MVTFARFIVRVQVADDHPELEELSTPVLDGIVRNMEKGLQALAEMQARPDQGVSILVTKTGD